MSPMGKLVAAVGVAACLGVAAYAAYAYSVLPLGAAVSPHMRTAFEAHPVRILVHVFSSLVALGVGPLQFFPAIRRRKSVHRRLGYVYLGAVGIGGTSGVVTAFIATGGLPSQVGFAMLAVAWLYSGLRALFAVRGRALDEHRRWAVRCFALTFAAVTLRVYLGLFFASGVAFDRFYPLLAWLSWVPNLLVVEWFVLPGLTRRSEHAD